MSGQHCQDMCSTTAAGLQQACARMLGPRVLGQSFLVRVVLCADSSCSYQDLAAKTTCTRPSESVHGVMTATVLCDLTD